jgi:hypothetical protein
MRPINFEQANKTLSPARYKKEYSSDVEGIDHLPVFTNSEQCISCWQMSWRERFSALLFGKVWLQVLSGESQPPVCIRAQKSLFLARKVRRQG